MATIQTLKFPEGTLGKREADVVLLGKRPHRRILREAAIMYQANQHAGTHCTKTRAEVAGTGKKPWAQKHTGRARAGTVRSPLWRKGGIIHGPRPRDYSWHMPRKALRAAVRSALLGKFLDEEVVAMDGVVLETPSTKKVAAALRALGVQGTALLVTPAHDDLVFRSARNIAGASVKAAAEVNAYDLMAHRNVVLVNGAFDPLMKAAGVGEVPAAGAAPAPAKAAKRPAAKKPAARKEPR